MVINKGEEMKIKEQQKLADRQDYLVDRLTNGEEEFLDMLEEFYDISITLNGSENLTYNMKIGLVEKLENEIGDKLEQIESRRS